VVIWDKIIEHPKDAKLLMDKATVEYGLIDQVIEKGALFVRVLLRVFAG
jgi:ATP-dependent protease ClpP protease subunit